MFRFRVTVYLKKVTDVTKHCPCSSVTIEKALIPPILYDFIPYCMVPNLIVYPLPHFYPFMYGERKLSFVYWDIFVNFNRN